MNPYYTFKLSVISSTTETTVVHPNYAASLTLNWEKQSGEEFFRRKLGGALTFYGSEYDWIMERASLSYKYLLKIYLNGSLYWTGQFYLTDCEINSDDKTITVTPQVVDQYTDILAGIDKEFDLIKLAPEIREIKYSKRPVVQVYAAGASVLGCFLSGMYWEQDCEVETNESHLTNTYKFYKNAIIRQVTATIKPASGEQVIIDSELYYGKLDRAGSIPYTLNEDGAVQGKKFKVYSQQETIEGETRTVYYYEITTSTGAVIYRYRSEVGPVAIDGMELAAYSSTVTGTKAVLSSLDRGVWMRAMCDVDTIGGSSTYPIPAEDITANNQNYTRVVPFNYPEAIIANHEKTTTTTEWGLYQPGYYYAYPAGYAAGVLNPIARKIWGELSLWFKFDDVIAYWETSARAENTLKDAYPLFSAISVLLGQIAPDITHQETTDYSQFLYSSNPIYGGIVAKPVIVPKSNVINSGYDQPAQKAPVTLRQILDMLKNVYRCYWFIDSSNRLRIEHIKYFNNGGSYSGTPGVSINLVNLINPRNEKSWNFGQNSWKYDKPETYGQLVFEWADDVSRQFEGWPINIKDSYVEQATKEEINVDGFTSDIDYILISPGEISKDGFVLLQPIASGSDYVLPYVTIQMGAVTYVLQNGYCAFLYSYIYYLWDLCAPNYEFGGITGTASATKKLRRQSVSFPLESDPDTNKLITTNFGNGKIEKITLSLLSRAAEFELIYDTDL